MTDPKNKQRSGDSLGKLIDERTRKVNEIDRHTIGDYDTLATGTGSGPNDVIATEDVWPDTVGAGDEPYVTIGNPATLSAERALTAGSNLVLTDGGANSTVTLNLNTIDQSCADNAATNIIIGAVASIMAIHIVYHAHTGAYYESGSAVLFTDGTNTAVCAWQRSYLGSGYCLDDDAGLSGDVNTGNLRLIVTTKSLAAACDFRATYTLVEA